ncbi:MAG: biotin/lipoyl-binding carrier protein [Euzebyaceae bacterium]|nr:biotin/lipoyl-binding carrier protein [Euzebyaceae bacterium]
MAHEVVADMAANVWKVLVSEGANVEAGETLVILESMKMEIPIDADVAGLVTSVGVEEGGSVQEGDVIAVIAVVE